MEYTSKYTMTQHQFIYFLICHTIVTVRTARKRDENFLEREVTIMVGNRTQFASGVFVVVTTLYAAPLWANQDHHASLATLQMSTQEARREAWLNPEKEGPLFTQSGRLLFRPGESVGISFKHGGMAGDGQRTRPDPQTYLDVSVNIRPGEISTHDLGAAGIPLWKW